MRVLVPLERGNYCRLLSFLWLELNQHIFRFASFKTREKELLAHYNKTGTVGKTDRDGESGWGGGGLTESEYLFKQTLEVLPQ